MSRMKRTSVRGVLVCVLFGLLAFAAGCGGGSSSTPPTTGNPPPSGSNVQPIIVSGGPLASSIGIYPDAAFTSVTICVPNTTNCQTINGLLVDTGSVGLRISSSADGGPLTLQLPQVNATDGNAIASCTQFIDGSFIWGPIQKADIQISGEKAGSVPIQVIDDQSFAVPTSCSNVGTPLESPSAIGANGILGVGSVQQDCGGFCGPGGTVQAGNYYECSSSSNCQPALVLLSQQAQNPVGLFPTDNNGVIVELPAVAAPEASLSGSLVFGIGTQSNNGLGSAKVYTMDPASLVFTTNFNTQSLTGSFIDSGSNGLFFNDASLPACSSGDGFYCPTNSPTLSATNVGLNGTTGLVTFGVINADAQLDAVLNGFAGEGFSDAFDWGLPFFFGRNVYVSIEGTTAPGGQTPYWAY